MKDSFPFISTGQEGIYLNILVQPRSSKNKVAGIQNDFLKVKLTAPPVDNAANEMCVKFFARLLGVPKSVITIVSGLKSRRKKLLIKTVTLSEVTEKLVNIL